jgi:hypothetical protein
MFLFSFRDFRLSTGDARWYDEKCSLLLYAYDMLSGLTTR